MAALLNSSLLNFYYRKNIFPRCRDVTMHHIISYLSKLIIPKLEITFKSTNSIHQ
ncbi:MAG: hypothetical protein H6540_07875 [Bacteroidales bacterium]|nr:hypothetical protein [Bacteroidales bacterium]